MRSGFIINPSEKGENMFELAKNVRTFAAFLALCGVAPIIKAQVASGIRDFRFTSATEGWIVSSDDLFLTGDGGQSWSAAKALHGIGYHVDGAFFLDSAQGWVVQHSDAGNVQVAKTTDRGQTWNMAAVRIDDFFSHAYSGHASVSFVNSRQGWLLLQQASSAATSTGKLFETDDGGGSWSELADPPVAGRISFLSDQIGWLQGGAGKLMLFKTADGGAHWVQQSVPPANSVPNPATTNFGLPVFSDPQAGSVSVTFGTAAHNVTEAAYSTSDGGQHWVLTHEFAGIPATVSAKANVVGGNLVVAMLRGGADPDRS